MYYHVFCHPDDQEYADQVLARLTLLGIHAEQIIEEQLPAIKPEYVIVLMTVNLFASDSIYSKLESDMLYIACRSTYLPEVVQRFFNEVWRTSAEVLLPGESLPSFNAAWDTNLKRIRAWFP